MVLSQYNNFELAKKETSVICLPQQSGEER